MGKIVRMRTLLDVTKFVVAHPCDCDEFSVDLAAAMLDLGLGYDPYNHVGYNVVSDAIGAP